MNISSIGIFGNPARADIVAAIAMVQERCATVSITVLLSQRLADRAGQPESGLDDADLVEQALQNLVMNAVRHNLPGGSVKVRLARDGDDALVCITNTGPEIRPADQKRIFDRFYRADSARSRHAGGVGLGLSLAREIARAHGGDLTLERSAEGLNTFALRLRAAPAEAGAAG